MVLGLATSEPKASYNLCKVIHDYAQILASQGEMDTALRYLDMIPGEINEDIVILKERICGSTEVKHIDHNIQQQPAYHFNQQHQQMYHQNTFKDESHNPSYPINKQYMDQTYGNYPATSHSYSQDLTYQQPSYKVLYSYFTLLYICLVSK